MNKSEKRRVAWVRSFTLLLVSLVSWGLMGCAEKKKRCTPQKPRYVFDAEENQRKHGLERGCWSKGFRRWLHTWKVGKKEGRSVIWYSNGQKEAEVFYKDGKRHGKGTRWNDKGQKVRVTSFVGGLREGEEHRWHDTGEKHLMYTYRKGRKHGPYIIWWRNGKVREQGSYTEGLQSGLETSWREDGTKSSQGTFVRGKRHGMWTTWSEKGKVIQRIRYVRGVGPDLKLALRRRPPLRASAVLKGLENLRRERLRGGGSGGGFLSRRRRRSRRVHLRMGLPVIFGALERASIVRVVRRHRRRILYCYERELSRSPRLRGKIKVFFQIEGNGRVSTSRVTQTTMNNDRVEQCLVRRARFWRFPAPQGGGIVHVNFPFFFKP